jgi:hypothetical protein
MQNEVIVREAVAQDLFHHLKPMDYQSAVSLALADLESCCIETSWCDALMNSQGDIVPVVLSTQAGMIIERK